jgi:DnaK suppressor protein
MAKSHKTPAKKSAKKAAPAKPTRRAKAKPAKAKHAKAKPAKPARRAKAKRAKPAKAAKAAKPAKVIPAKKPTPPTKVSKAPAGKPQAPAGKAKGPMSAADLKRMILERKSAGPAKSISFSLDEVREIAKKNETTVATSEKGAKTGKSGDARKHVEHKLEKPHKPNHVKRASLSDILGFNPAKGRKPALASADEVPEKFRRYYKLLTELRQHVLTQLGEHTEDTLLKSAKDDSGDLSGYGQHMADAGTDTFDRDFALSLVSSEQEALAEIEAAIKRIHDGSYGICELTQKPIAKERLLAVPFTRYTAEAQKNVERHSHRTQQRGGLFGDSGDEDGGKMVEEDAGGDD